ncbi:metallophosphoesterase family protein [Geomesophilobacter sediminis]|uniref:Serine/threonine protein phosphatase n=1 Tax=Geomesophilobacter sediminis TaxID=2798584 RepID=A0A8J7JBS7_9BACT|nr:metallophosphoesterase family protein [Geomesophilobacter sediminis]MBJ6724058.1 serine/threonine protein phosphatase [Geomesophilobacter sediminis]
MQKRTIAIADIHGCSKAFLSLLSKFGLNRSDTLFLLGDYLDRGPDPKGVIETVLQLSRDGYDIRPLRGNHEQMFLDALVWEDRSLWLSNGGIATLLSYGVTDPGQIPEEHLGFIESLPLFAMTSTHVFVHAGLDLTLDDPFGAEGTEAMLWARETFGSLTKLGGRTLVTGHTPMDLERIRSSLGTWHIELDNGCVFNGGNVRRGRLVAAVLETGQLFLQKCPG